MFFLSSKRLFLNSILILDLVLLSLADKAKPVMGKIVIKDLKFSSVFEATVKEVEEQAKAKAEKYEEGELSDSSSQKTSSDQSDDPCNGPSLGSGMFNDLLFLFILFVLYCIVLSQLCCFLYL